MLPCSLHFLCILTVDAIGMFAELFLLGHYGFCLSQKFYFWKLFSVLNYVHFHLLSLGVTVNDVVPWVLDVILNKHIPSPNPHVRQAACIWLLSLVRKLSSHKEVKVSHCRFRGVVKQYLQLKGSRKKMNMKFKEPIQELRAVH